MCRAGAYLGPGPGLCRRLGRRRLGRCCPGCSLGCRLLGWLPFPLRWGRRVRGLRSHRLACDTGAGKQPDPCVARVMRCWPCAPKSDCFSSFGNGGKASVGEGPCRPLFDGGAPVGLPALPRFEPPLPGLPRRPFFFAILACSCKGRQHCVRRRPSRNHRRLRKRAPWTPRRREESTVGTA